MKKLMIFGAGETAFIAAEFFTVDSTEKIAGFIVDDEFYSEGASFHDRPVLSQTNFLSHYPASKYKVFVALSYGQLNRERERVYSLYREIGYEFATYISSDAMVWRTAQVGDNCMIFEGNNIQHGVQIKNNVMLWSGNHVGHGSQINQSVYLSSHVCIAGSSEIGARSFLGINSAVADQITVAEDNFIGAGAVVNRNTLENSIYTGNPAVRNERVPATKYFKVESE